MDVGGNGVKNCGNIGYDNYFNLNSGMFCVLYLKNEGLIKIYFCIFSYICRIRKRNVLPNNTYK